jgi:gamma-glutamyltranspeptidase
LFLIGIDAAVKKLANFDLKTLLEPALYFAENGFELPHLLSGLIAEFYNDITLLRTEDG